ncbi:MAG: cyclic nucleotide-binding domain-containing protein, partial [Terriglobia bacterium]
VRLHVTDSRGSRRITSLGRGTIFGEMALIEGARRSATIVADEDVVCYQLSGDDFNVMLRDKPDIAAKIMRNTARELVRRLRQTSEDLRHATS